MEFRKLLSLVTVLALFGVAACGGGEEAASTSEPTTSEPAATAPDLSNAGGVDGMVMFSGDAPSADPVAMAADPFCQSSHSDAVMQAPVMVTADGGLRNVVVHVAGGLDGYTFDTPSEAIELDQQGCLYDPHVLSLQTGQTLIVRNSDDTLHNVNVQPSNNSPFNQGQPVAGMTLEHTFENPEVGIPARCDVHPWMGAFISVFEHPYFAVSGDNGEFSIGQLPPGDYVIEAWHETLGTQTQSVTVAPNETGSITIGFEG